MCSQFEKSNQFVSNYHIFSLIKISRAIYISSENVKNDMHRSAIFITTEYIHIYKPQNLFQPSNVSASGSVKQHIAEEEFPSASFALY